MIIYGFWNDRGRLYRIAKMNIQLFDYELLYEYDHIYHQ